MKKIFMLLLLALLIAGVTLPQWGSCELQAEVCSRWCGLRHYDSSVDAAACRAECVGKRVKCMMVSGGAK